MLVPKRTVDLRRLNHTVLLRHLYLHGPMSRLELSQQTDLSPSTVTNVVTALIQDGVSFARLSLGRHAPPSPLRIGPEVALVVLDAALDGATRRVRDDRPAAAAATGGDHGRVAQRGDRLAQGVATDAELLGEVTLGGQQLAVTEHPEADGGRELLHRGLEDVATRRSQDCPREGVRDGVGVHPSIQYCAGSRVNGS